MRGAAAQLLLTRLLYVLLGHAGIGRMLLMHALFHPLFLFTVGAGGAALVGMRCRRGRAGARVLAARRRASRWRRLLHRLRRGHASCSQQNQGECSGWSVHRALLFGQVNAQPTSVGARRESGNYPEHRSAHTYSGNRRHARDEANLCPVALRLQPRPRRPRRATHPGRAARDAGSSPKPSLESPRTPRCRRAVCSRIPAVRPRT